MYNLKRNVLYLPLLIIFLYQDDLENYKKYKYSFLPIDQCVLKENPHDVFI